MDGHNETVIAYMSANNIDSWNGTVAKSGTKNV
jgi:hypothetical protein